VVGYETGIPQELKTILFDPQTAGGLLISVSPDDASELNRALRAAGVRVADIGRIRAQTEKLVTVNR
jgi:selenide, water dikinase